MVVVGAVDLGDMSMAMNDEVFVLLFGVMGALLMAAVVVVVVLVVVVVGRGEETRGESICMRCRAKGGAADATAACCPAVAVVVVDTVRVPKGRGTTVLLLLVRG